MAQSSIIEGVSLEALNDAVQLAFFGEPFQVDPDREMVEKFGAWTVLASSARFKNVYDPNAGLMAEISQYHALLHDAQSGVVVGENRLSVDWEDGTSYEVELGAGEIIEEDEDPEIVKQKIVRALGAATNIV